MVERKKAQTLRNQKKEAYKTPNQERNKKKPEDQRKGAEIHIVYRLWSI